MFTKQFFGKLTLPMLASITVLHVLAIFVRETPIELPLLVVIGLVTFALCVKRLELGLYVAFVEIFVGGHGHLLDADLFGFSVSIRIAIFGAVMLGWVVQMLRKQNKLMVVPIREIPWLVLLLAVLLGTIIGFIENDPAQAFDDMNGFLTIAYLLPIISIAWDQAKKRELLQVLAASVAWLVFFTLLLSFLFTHLDGKSLSHVYRFVRDSRLAEVTLQTVSDSNGNITSAYGAKLLGVDGYWYRIFMQSQFFVMAAGILLLSMIYLVWRGERVPWQAGLAFVLLGSVIPLSTSRSFFLGLFAAGLCVLILSLAHGKKALASTAKRSVLVAGAVIGSGVVAWATIVFPFPPQPDIADAAFYSTSADSGRDLAVSSRWQLLPPMMQEIYSSPIIGSGFGEEVTFISDDPRVRAINPNGEWTTYRFEWGYQDLWLKMGLLGLIAFGLYAYSITKATIYSAKKHGFKWIIFGFTAGVVLLYVASIFSPFMNHPIGLGFMLFILPFYDWTGLKKGKTELIKMTLPVKVPSVEMTPALTEIEES